MIQKSEQERCPAYVEIARSGTYRNSPSTHFKYEGDCTPHSPPPKQYYTMLVEKEWADMRHFEIQVNRGGGYNPNFPPLTLKECTDRPNHIDMKIKVITEEEAKLW